MSSRVTRDEDISSLLELWGLEERELNGEALVSVSIRGQRPSLLQGALLRDPSTELPSGALDATSTYTADIICAMCGRYNDRRAHWCIECGTAVVEPFSSSVKIPTDMKHSSELESHLDFSSSARSQIHDPNTASDASINHSSHMFNTESHYQTTQVSAQQYTSKSNDLGTVSKSNDLGTVSQRQGHSLRANASNRRASYIHSPGRCSNLFQAKSVRCWETSGVYMWRKPSSVKSVGLSPRGKSTLTKCTQGVTESGLQPNSRVSVTLDLLQTQRRNVDTTAASSKSSPPLLLCLPAELLLLILSSLSQSELARCMLVCQRIYVIASDPCLWKSVLVSRKRNVNDDMLWNVSKRRPQSLTLAHVSGYFSYSTLQNAFTLMNALQELTIDTCDLGPFTGDQLLISASIHCHQLNTVDIRWTHLSDKAFSLFSMNCHRLKKISVENAPQISINTFQLLLQRHSSRLTHVKIQGNMGFSLHNLMKNCASESIVCPNVTSFSSDHKTDTDEFKRIFPSLQQS